MKKSLALAASLSAVALLSACHPLRWFRSGGSCHETKPYTKAASVAPLKIPTGLDAPDTTNALHVPTLNEPAPPPRKPKDPCLEEPPPFQTAKRPPPQA